MTDHAYSFFAGELPAGDFGALGAGPGGGGGVGTLGTDVG